MPQPDHQIPSQAKRVFKGIAFEVWQWEQKMFDGTTAMFERVKAQDSVQVIAAVEGKILLQDQEQPHREGKFQSLPGGRCEWDEDPVVCAKREFLEETGYSSDNWTLFLKISPMGRMAWTIYTFIARDCRKIAEPHLDAGERIENRLIGFEELLKLDNEPRFRSLGPTLIRANYDLEFRSSFKHQIFG
jgi:ADP-ribose pyrophosphatase